MFCPECGNQNGNGVSFCRRCGAELANSSLAAARQNLRPERSAKRSLTEATSADPDELVGNGIGSVIVGDGFFIVAVVLSATDSAASSLLWLFLLIPAFYCFGRGMADVLHAREIRRRQKEGELSGGPQVTALPPARESVVDIIKKSISGELAAAQGVAERTTRDL